jgi:hypothetical protein
MEEQNDVPTSEQVVKLVSAILSTLFSRKIALNLESTAAALALELGFPDSNLKLSALVEQTKAKKTKTGKDESDFSPKTRVVLRHRNTSLYQVFMAKMMERLKTEKVGEDTGTKKMLSLSSTIWKNLPAGKKMEFGKSYQALLDKLNAQGKEGSFVSTDPLLQAVEALENDDLNHTPWLFDSASLQAALAHVSTPVKSPSEPSDTPEKSATKPIETRTKATAKPAAAKPAVAKSAAAMPLPSKPAETEPSAAETEPGEKVPGSSDDEARKRKKEEKKKNKDMKEETKDGEEEDKNKKKKKKKAKQSDD